MLTFSGVHVSRDFGAPTIRDIAVQSMRLVRWSGGGEVFWPIGMHCLLVADLMPKSLEKPIRPMQQIPVDPWLEVHALLHDAAEVAVADVPRPMKTAEARALEDRVTARIYAALGVPEPTDEVKAAVKEADFRAALAEGVLGCAGRGYEQTQTGFRHDDEAVAILGSCLARYTASEALAADGFWPLEYERRLRKALRAAQHGVSYAPDAEVPTDPRKTGTPGRGWSERVMQAVADLYQSQEHRPSCDLVQQTVIRAMLAQEEL